MGCAVVNADRTSRWMNRIRIPAVGWLRLGSFICSGTQRGSYGFSQGDDIPTKGEEREK